MSIDDYETEEERLMERIRLETIEQCARAALTVQDSGHGLMSVQIAAAIRALKGKDEG